MNPSKNVVQFFILTLVVFLVAVGTAPAVTDVSGAQNYSFYGTAMGAGLGAALTLIGAGWGFGRIGAAALESMARQPEVAPRLFTTMLLIGALLEGATFFSLIVCILIIVL